MSPEPWSNDNFNIPASNVKFQRIAICLPGTNDLIMLDINSSLSDRS